MSKRDDDKTKQELQDLWQRRDHLDEREWNQLYELVYRILSAQKGRFGSLLQKLPEDFNTYVLDFFTRKVFEPTRRENFVATASIIPRALRIYFKRFLLDRWDENERQPQAAGLPLDEENEDVDVFEFLHPSTIDPSWRPSPKEQEWHLWEAELDLPTVTASAKDFFKRLTPKDQFLFKARFVEKELNAQVGNVYYAASRLGVGQNQHHFPDYRKTRIGAWLTQPRDGDPPGLGLSLQADDREVVFIVLQILRACALDGVDADRRSGSGPADPPPPDA